MDPNFPLPNVTKSLDFELIQKSSAIYSDTPANKDGKEVSLNETQLTFTSPVVYGFSLADKRWGKLFKFFVRVLRHRLRLYTVSLLKHRTRQDIRVERRTFC